MSKASNNSALATLNTFEALAVTDGLMNSNGFFAQEESSFDMDLMPSRSRVSLEGLLEKEVDFENVKFLKEYFAGSSAVTFTPANSE